MLIITALTSPCPRVSAQQFPVDPELPLATGAFIQVNGALASNSASWWQTELAAMKAVGMDTVVVNYVAYDKFYFYPTNVPGGLRFFQDGIENVMDAADQHGLKVYLGMHLDSNQFTTSTFDLADNLAQGQAELNELWTRYGGHSSMAGWYMPQELSDAIVFGQPRLRDDILDYTKAVTDQAHAISGLPMMISPYFGRTPNPSAYANWWDTVGIPETGIDILAMQDGVGTHRTSIATSRSVFQALAPVLEKHDVSFWANNESFNQIHGWPVDSQPWAAVPVGINTFVDQIVATAPFVEKSITFEFSHYMSPQGSAAMRQLYEDYETYLGRVLRAESRVEIASYAYELPPTTIAHSLANDTNRARLTDGFEGSLSGGPNAAFANGTWAGFGRAGGSAAPAQVRVEFELEATSTVNEIDLFYLVSANPSIFSPQPIPGMAEAMTIESSLDGVSWLPVVATSDFVPWTIDAANGAFEVRSITLNLGGVKASHLALNVVTPNTWLFLGEFMVFSGTAVPEPAVAPLALVASVGACLRGRRRRLTASR